MKDLLGHVLCNLCGKRADGPMLVIPGTGGEEQVHAACVDLELARLLDPEWEEGMPDPPCLYTGKKESSEAPGR